MSGDSPFPEAVEARGLNSKLVDALLDRVQARLRAVGVRDRDVALVRVPGSNELPVAARLLTDRRPPDVVIALGVIIRGGTIHYELVARSATQGLQAVALDSRVPVINGVVVAENASQAKARCAGRIDRGAEFADAAVSMAALKRRLSR